MTDFRKNRLLNSMNLNLLLLLLQVQVEQMTQHIGSSPENRLQVEQVAWLPELALGVAVWLRLWHDRCASHKAIEYTGWNYPPTFKDLTL
ncbi:hypothetical protein M0R45_035926 [Rubus argutus]|uniref:Uncharacterized protein n=1 Tax=Rubus argutus TaxID=59490 RepID=A0AAW1VYE8_RUBAR